MFLKYLLFLGSHNTALLLRACHDLHGSFLDVLHGDGLAAAAGSQQSGLIDQVLQVSTRKACGALCDDSEGDIGIRPDDLARYSRIRLFNAMIEFGEIEFSVDKIVL